MTEALDRLSGNTTQALTGDIEAVRTHLGIERWLVSGISWGTTLALAYAQDHPDRVTEMVLVAVTTTRREEVDWITEAVGRVFPETWEHFARTSQRRPGERIVEAYARRLAGSHTEDRLRAARDWNDWESVHVSLDPHWSAGQPNEDPRQSLVFATLVTHYWSNDGFLKNGNAIANRLHLLRDIPAVLLHGRRDISGPVATPWHLHRQWPASRLHIVESEGHGGPELMERMRLACDAFA